MRTLSSFACVSLFALLSACGPAEDGYYDANGNWIARNPYNSSHPPLPGGTHDPRYDSGDDRVVTTTVTTYKYDRPGYYNANGSYIGRDSDFDVPADMFPPRGMCRVWFTDRDLGDQPPVESCKGIRSRVPAGAYVIYGG